MRTLGEVEAIEWLSSRGLTDLQGKCLSSGFARQATFPIPPDSGKKTVIARELAYQFGRIGESILWIDEFGFSGPNENWYLFDMFRQSLGESKRLYDSPGHVFTSSDTEAVFALLSMVLYFDWGAILASSSGEMVVRISHDEFLDVYAKNGFGDDIFNLLRNVTGHDILLS